MFGWKIVHESVLRAERALDDGRLADARAKITELTRLVEYLQERADAERIRADRLLDSLIQQNGLPPVSETTHNEIKERVKASDKQIEEQEKFMREMFAETDNSMNAEPEEFEDARS